MIKYIGAWYHLVDDIVEVRQNSEQRMNINNMIANYLMQQLQMILQYILTLTHTPMFQTS